MLPLAAIDYEGLISRSTLHPEPWINAPAHDGRELLLCGRDILLASSL